jgi:hypothetical protein
MNDAQFTHWMNHLERSGTDAVLPDPNAIWWRAQLRQRLELEERATRPLRIAERLACAVCLLTAAVLSAVLTWVKL